MLEHDVMGQRLQLALIRDFRDGTSDNVDSLLDERIESLEREIERSIELRGDQLDPSQRPDPSQQATNEHSET